MTELPSLLDGYSRFRGSSWRRERARWAELAEGQQPSTLVIACSDSRVDPAQIFDAAPGDIFVVRNVAALVPPCETGGGQHGVSAALEFAVTQLKVSDVLVLGHEFCGGCKAALTRVFDGAADGEGGFVAKWVSLLDDARDKVGDGDDALPDMEREAVRTSLANLRTFPFVREAEAAGSLTLTGARFSIRTGELEVLDEAQGRFAAA